MKKNLMNLLYSAIVNFPILKEAGYDLQKLPVIISDPKDFPTVKRAFLPNAIQISEETSHEEFLELLDNSSSDLIMYHYCPSKSANLFMSRLSTITKTGLVCGKKLLSLPVVITDSIPILEERNNLFEIFVNDSEQFGEISKNLSIPPDDQIPIVLRSLSEKEWKSDDPDLNALKAASYFLLPNLRKNGKDDDLFTYFKLCEELVTQNEMDGDLENVTEIFLASLDKWQQRNRFSHVVKLPNLSYEEVHGLESALFYDDQYFFIRESLFRKIVGPALPSVPISILRRDLNREGILLGSKEKTFTTKMGYRSPDGTWDRLRMLKFDREKATQPGELDFVSRILIGREG